MNYITWRNTLCWYVAGEFGSDESEFERLEMVRAKAIELSQHENQHVRVVARWIATHTSRLGLLRAYNRLEEDVPAVIQKCISGTYSEKIIELPDSINEVVVELEIYRKAIEMRPHTSWSQIAEQLTSDRDGWRAFRAAVVRYAALEGLVLPAGKPGAKRTKK